MKDGKEVVIRPIRPEDEPMMIEFHKKLSERSVYLRYFQPLKLTQRTAHERLTRICFIDYNREMALVAERKNEAANRRSWPSAGSARSMAATRPNWRRWPSMPPSTRAWARSSTAG